MGSTPSSGRKFAVTGESSTRSGGPPVPVSAPVAPITWGPDPAASISNDWLRSW
jgi:hypothetical protein